jgi:hypothetical protein
MEELHYSTLMTLMYNYTQLQRATELFGKEILEEAKDKWKEIKKLMEGGILVNDDGTINVKEVKDQTKTKKGILH